MHHRLRICRLTALQNNYFCVFSNCKNRMAELYVCVCIFLCVFFFLLWHMHRYTTLTLVQTTRDVCSPRLQWGIKEREENKTHKHNITGTFFHMRVGGGVGGQCLKLAADLFKTMGFNSHIRLFCSHWHGVGKWSENMAEGQNIFSPFLFFCSSQSYCLSIFRSCQLKRQLCCVFWHGKDFRFETAELNTVSIRSSRSIFWVFLFSSLFINS